MSSKFLGKPISTYSEACELLIFKIESMGFAVNIDPKSDVQGGQVDYQKRLVTVNCPEAKVAAIVLAHEAGHCAHYLQDPLLEQNCTREMRERHASLKGWEIILDLELEHLFPSMFWRNEALGIASAFCLVAATTPASVKPIAVRLDELEQKVNEIGSILEDLTRAVEKIVTRLELEAQAACVKATVEENK
jgi:sensor histidine kinase YesM